MHTGMKSFIHISSSRINLAWMALLGTTLLSWWLAEGTQLQGPEPLAITAVVALSGFKGYVIALDFLELRHAPRIWRNALLAWLAFVLLAIYGAAIWFFMQR